MPHDGPTRDTFYRYRDALADGGIEVLQQKNRRKPNLKNRVDERVEKAVVEMATLQPQFGQVRASNELRKQEIFISPAGVRSIWLRHDLATFKRRLVALEEHVSRSGGVVLTEAQVIPGFSGCSDKTSMFFLIVMDL